MNSGPEGRDLPIFNFHVEFAYFGDAQIGEAFGRGFNGITCGVFPRLGAGADEFDDFVDAVGHSSLSFQVQVGVR